MDSFNSENNSDSLIRLSYTKKIDNSYVSNLVPLGSDMVFGYIDSELNCSVCSINDEGVSAIFESKGKDLKECKTMIRYTMEKCGVIFKDDIRVGNI